MARKLNAGCGNNILPGYVNLDVDKVDGVDVVHDLTRYPYPFQDEYFDYILMDNVIEHLDDTVGVMAELHRILRPGGRLVLKFPYYLHPNAWLDPTHKKCLTEVTFNFFVKDITTSIVPGEDEPRLIHSVARKDRLFSSLTYKYIPTKYGKLFGSLVRYARHFCTVLIYEVEVTLVK